MNEKEALTGLKNLSQIFKLCSENDVKLKDFNIMNPKAYKEAIETILDLYNKEKENTKYWKDRYKNEVENEAILIEHISVLAETMGLEKIKDNLFEFIHINGYLDLYNPGNASIPIKTIDSWRKNVKALCDIATKQEKMIELMAEHISFGKDIQKILCSPKVHGKDDCIGITCKRCIKQYFEKKAEESE